jgi:predicted nucleic acid-binding protein
VSLVLLDTTAYSHAVAGRAAACAAVQTADRILMCPVVLGELLSGFSRGTRKKQNRAVLDEFLSSHRVELVEVTGETAAFYAAVLDGLREQGTPIPTNDVWIAACAMEHGAHLVSSDSHFRHVKGLMLDAIELD